MPEIARVLNWAIEHTPAHFGDAPEAVDVSTSAWRSSRRMYPWLVATDDAGRFLGFAKSGAWKTRAAYAWTVEISVYVRPEAHRRGAGRALYTRLLEVLRAQGYRTLVAGITLPNPASEGLHEAMGMRRVASFPRMGHKFGHWHDVGYWSLELDADVGPPAEIRAVAEVLGSIPHED